ncbi:sulfatase family protein [Lentisphaera araneosa HTCC2155]|uniref:Sulfatase family protein n=1 Tax=Lentisphaera araneosa HTCC2155 TaxID=313628 RepID=A6DJJ1_9BACT|nr:sulfatase [Lentisphaera araneosa]EDM28065.1 sulfatase family protein [Lentisphaera araneosa HTCC2155]
MIKSVLVVMFIITSQVALATSPLAEAKSKKMNVLFIPIDDLKPMLGCYGDQAIITPNIDRIAERGTVFLNASCQQAICGPSRASLMTGMYPDHTKVWDLATKMRDINPDILSIPQYFKQQGYETTGVGKTFDPRCVDGGKFQDKPSWSIPYHKAGGKGYANPEVAKAWKKAAELVKGRTFKMGYQRNKAMARLGDPICRPATECMDVPDHVYKDGAVARVGAKLLEELSKADKPFFLSVGFAKPHLPFVAPKKYWDMYNSHDIQVAEYQKSAKNDTKIAYKSLGEIAAYSDMPEKGPIDQETQKHLIHGYMATTSYMDAQLGLLLDKLEELGIANNTIICLWGDHGFHLGDHGMWTKHTNFEQAVRSPLLIAAPKGFKPNSTNAPVELVDIFPTLCDLAGLDIPTHLPGKSLAPVMKDTSTSVRYAALGQYPRGNKTMGYTLRSERYRYVKWLNLDYRKSVAKGKLVATQLFDYEKDPLETVNLAANPEYKKIIDSFEAEFARRNVAQVK